VNKSAGHVKCEKPKQPKNDKNRGNYPEHVFISIIERENLYDLILANCADASSRSENSARATG